ncbi:hypothetical protein [Devosia sp. RR2S18]|uniref:COG3904 family protein n=1 Tax=Devosia rhizosphaerae TaxID=3049774 RepID=UPI002540D1E7|nr:hypothetical protein [Devosia sp. RR2S18]WIJ26586.1 hypothetical protein QOV41_07500 [Devosia sp. RR2S18]
MLLYTLCSAPALAEMHQFGAFVVDDQQPEIIVLAGDIQHNAPIDFRRATRRFPDLQTLGLHSNGGDVTAGLLLAQEVFDRNMDTYIAPESGCYSACAFIFLAGKNRLTEGELGVHQISNESRDLYSVQVSIGDMLDTLSQFEVPASVISEMLRTPPESMRIYTSKEAAQVGLSRGREIDTAAEVTMPSAASPPDAGGSGPWFDAPVPDAADDSDQMEEGNFPILATAYLLTSNAPEPYIGTVWWTKTTDEQGNWIVVAEATVADGDTTIDAKLTWRKNTDTSLPAAVVVDVKFHLGGAGPRDNISALPGMLAKNTAFAVGEPLVGASAKTRDNAFLFALSGDEAHITDNSILLTESFYDLALVMESGRNALLTLQKGEAGDRMFLEVVESWVD